MVLILTLKMKIGGCNGKM